MDRYIAGRSDTRIKIIHDILEKADIPEFWYSINNPLEGHICIDMYVDGTTHVYTQERGRKLGEKVYSNWMDAIDAFADRLELEYTLKLKECLKDYSAMHLYRIIDRAALA